MEPLDYSTISSIPSSDSPIQSMRPMPLSIKYSKTQKIIQEILQHLPELAEVLTGVSIFSKILSNKSTYSGQVIDDKKHGIGKEVYSSGIIYYGQYANDKQNGLGFLHVKITRNWVEYYKGYFIDSNFHGYGEYHCNENYYKGNWNTNLKHGFGKEKIGNFCYEGEFRLGTKEGKGKSKNMDGKFKGRFKDDQPVKGEFRGRNGEFIYSGRYKDGKWHGSGSLVLSDDSPIKSFIGKFRKGSMSEGVLMFHDGKEVRVITER